MDLVKNIKQMFSTGDGHVLVLAASIRSLEHLLYCFLLETELVTVPAKVLELWASKNFPMPDKDFQYKPSLEPLPYEELDLEQSSEAFDVQHELTRKGIEKFVADYRATLSHPRIVTLDHSTCIGLQVFRGVEIGTRESLALWGNELVDGTGIPGRFARQIRLTKPCESGVSNIAQTHLGIESRFGKSETQKGGFP